MKLYSGPLSLFSGKVRIALAEKGLSYELVSVPFTRAGYQPKHPVVAAVNPKAQVPVLEDGELMLCDSTLILEYLEDRHRRRRSIRPIPWAAPAAGSSRRRRTRSSSRPS
jgi:glutathione S-transferase